jgi:UDP-N-acetylglucosamine--N-acetylmuramyl-(pentapeptide) pyrophosphoryl-undecaprenol N-acetylglucosamine transferase
MNFAYSAATLVVCRAGAASIAEITSFGLPSILVPYPKAAADHQYKNARALSDTGAAVLVEDKALASLETQLLSLLADDAALTRMAKKCTTLGKPHAAFELAQAVLHLIEDNRK